MKAIQVKVPGGPESMVLAEVPTPSPAAQQVLVRLAVSGVNFIDVYFRTGAYKADAPFLLGMEGAGTVEAVGSDVRDFARGDRVAWAMIRGSYAEFAVVPVSHLVKVPDAVSFEQAAAVMLQGMTAHYLTRSTYALKAGDSCLVHAAAGGTGGLIVQMARACGARVFGTVSTEEKARIARAHGVEVAILYTQQDFEAEVKALTGGRGVDVVYDSVGKTTFDKSLNSLRPRGVLALFGMSSGPVAPLDPGVLAGKGSLFLTRPTLAHHVLNREELAWRAGDVLNAVAAGTLKVRIDATYPLASAAEAHKVLEGRGTTGKLLISVSS